MSSCRDMKAVPGCYITEKGEKRSIVIHYEYGVGPDNNLILVSTRYTESDGVTFIALAEGDKIDACCCDGLGKQITTETTPYCAFLDGDLTNCADINVVEFVRVFENCFEDGALVSREFEDYEVDGVTPFDDSVLTEESVALACRRDDAGNLLICHETCYTYSPPVLVRPVKAVKSAVKFQQAVAVKQAVSLKKTLTAERAVAVPERAERAVIERAIEGAPAEELKYVRGTKLKVIECCPCGDPENIVSQEFFIQAPGEMDYSSVEPFDVDGLWTEEPCDPSADCPVDGVYDLSDCTIAALVGCGDKIGDEMCYGEQGTVDTYSYTNTDNETEGSFSTNATTIKWEVGGGDGSLDGSIPYVDDCINGGGVATMTIMDTAGNTVIFEADTIISSAATAAAYGGSTAGSFSGKVNSVEISCSTSAAAGGKACAFLQADGEVKWIDTTTGVELDAEQQATLAPCKEDCVEICPDCPEENIQFVVCSTEDSDAGDVSVDDQILTLAIRDCNGVIVSSEQYNLSAGNLPIEGPVSTAPCDPEPDIETIRECIVDAEGVQWTQIIIFDPDQIQPDNVIYYDDELVPGTPAGEPKEWTACPNLSGLEDVEKVCFEFLGQQVDGYAFAYSDGEVQLALSMDATDTVTGATVFCCDDCIQVFGCRDGRLAWPAGAVVTMSNGDVLDIAGLRYTEVAQLIVDNYGGTFNAPSLGGPGGPNFSQCQGSSQHELQFYNLGVDIVSIDELTDYGKFGNCVEPKTETVTCKKIKLDSWMWNNDNRGCGPVQNPNLSITAFGDWTIDTFVCGGRNLIGTPIDISYASWDDNFNEWTNNLNPLIAHNLDWINMGKPCYRVMSTMTCGDTIYGDFEVTLVNAINPVHNTKAQGQTFLIQPEVVSGQELEIDVCITKFNGKLSRKLFDKQGNEIEDLIAYVAEKYAHIVDVTTGRQIFSIANITKIFGDSDALCECLVDCAHVYPTIDTTPPCTVDVSEGGCIYDAEGNQLETGISQTILYAQDGSIKGRFYVVGIFNEDANDDVEYVLPEGAFYDRTCTGTREEVPEVIVEDPCVPFEVYVKYPDTAAGCLKATQWMNPIKKTVTQITTIDGVDVMALLEDCGIELEYCADCCCDCDLTIQEPECPAFQSDSENTVFTRDVTYTRGENAGQLVGPFGWEEGDQVSFPLVAGANYLADFTHCMSIDQSCCLLGLDPSLPITVRVTFDHLINLGSGGTHTGFNISPGPGSIVASAPTNTTAATIGGPEGVREDRWIDIEYTLGDMLSREACFSTSALGTSNSLGEGPLPDDEFETIYSMNVSISPDFLTQLTDILAACPCGNAEGLRQDDGSVVIQLNSGDRIYGLAAQAMGEQSGVPTEAALNSELVSRGHSSPKAPGVVDTENLKLTVVLGPDVFPEETVTSRTKAIVKDAMIKEDAKVAEFKSKKVLATAVAKKVATKTATKKG